MMQRLYGFGTRTESDLLRNGVLMNLTLLFSLTIFLHWACTPKRHKTVETAEERKKSQSKKTKQHPKKEQSSENSTVKKEKVEKTERLSLHGSADEDDCRQPGSKDAKDGSLTNVKQDNLDPTQAETPKAVGCGISAMSSAPTQAVSPIGAKRRPITKPNKRKKNERTAETQGSERREASLVKKVQIPHREAATQDDSAAVWSAITNPCTQASLEQTQEPQPPSANSHSKASATGTGSTHRSSGETLSRENAQSNTVSTRPVFAIKKPSAPTQSDS